MSKAINDSFVARRLLAFILLACTGFMPSFSLAQTTEDQDTALQEWRTNIAKIVARKGGCYHFRYPSMTPISTRCEKEHSISYGSNGGVGTQNVGNGIGYTADLQPTYVYSSMAGSFFLIQGVTSVSTDAQSDVYSLQINTNFLPLSPACRNRPNCKGWQQFIYSSGLKRIFIQSRAINYGSACPAGWTYDSNDKSCFRTSKTKMVPRFPIGELRNLRLYGTVLDGSDVLTFSHDFDSWLVSVPDNVFELSKDWRQAEFNIFGDGHRSTAVFNKGSEMQVHLAGTGGPVYCGQNNGTTAESNNLTVGGCTPNLGTLNFIQSN